MTASGNTTTEVALGIVSNANGSPRIAPDSVATAYGVNLAATLVPASSATSPASLGRVSIKVKDSAGVERLADLHAVSPARPTRCAKDDGARQCDFTIGSTTGGAQIAAQSPGILAIGRGVALAAAALYSADGTNTAKVAA